ncbi:MAG: glycosyltransferase family 2 protein [Gammaproteobacteria bacterium]|nr:MAG: glycosyltransferase family 2 protein [Gammaproteobacteria bacterium]
MPANTDPMEPKTSIILPARNEGQNLRRLLPALCTQFRDCEIIVVNDGSTDDTAEVCASHPITLISHPYSMGNGAAIKTGARAATGKLLVFMDADGQHRVEDIPRLLEKLEEGYEMVVGARHSDTQSSLARRMANSIYNRLASMMTGYKVEDLTSGFRAVRARHFRKFLYLLPNGFSYPTTSTMAFFRSGLPVAYIPIRAEKREGKSKISLFKDGLRFFIIIIKVGSLFSPMRLFLPVSLLLFFLGLGYYSFTFITEHRFTNMSALLLTTAVLVFLIGILSEQVSALHYKGADDDYRRTKRTPGGRENPE